MPASVKAWALKAQLSQVAINIAEMKRGMTIYIRYSAWLLLRQRLECKAARGGLYNALIGRVEVGIGDWRVKVSYLEGCRVSEDAVARCRAKESPASLFSASSCGDTGTG